MDHMDTCCFMSPSTSPPTLYSTQGTWSMKLVYVLMVWKFSQPKWDSSLWFSTCKFSALISRPTSPHKSVVVFEGWHPYVWEICMLRDDILPYCLPYGKFACWGMTSWRMGKLHIEGWHPAVWGITVLRDDSLSHVKNANWLEKLFSRRKTKIISLMALHFSRLATCSWSFFFVFFFFLFCCCCFFFFFFFFLFFVFTQPF